MIVVYGEVLIDMIETNSSFNYFIGGAPFNVAYTINKLNQDVRFVGNVGENIKCWAKTPDYCWKLCEFSAV